MGKMGGALNNPSQLLSKKQGPVLETDLDLNLLYYLKYYEKSLVENSTRRPLQVNVHVVVL
jgi:hypothetical protein